MLPNFDAVGECHDYVLDTLTDADKRGKIAAITGKDIRDQLTIADAINIRRDAELRRRWPENN